MTPWILAYKWKEDFLTMKFISSMNEDGEQSYLSLAKLLVFMV